MKVNGLQIEQMERGNFGMLMEIHVFIEISLFLDEGEWKDDKA